MCGAAGLCDLFRQPRRFSQNRPDKLTFDIGAKGVTFLDLNQHGLDLGLGGALAAHLGDSRFEAHHHRADDIQYLAATLGDRLESVPFALACHCSPQAGARSMAGGGIRVCTILYRIANLWR